MPWHIEEIEGEYCVVKDSDGEVEGCHEMEDGAEEQMAALYASEAERVGLIDWLKGVFAPINRLFTQVRAWSGDASNYDSTEAYCSACLIDLNTAAGNDEKVQSHCMLPVKAAGSDSIDWEGIQAAAGGHGIQAVEKPEGVPDDEWQSALKTAANKIISEYNDHDETAPDAVYKIADKEPPKENSMSERIVGLEMAFDQVYAQMWEDEDLSGTWIHDLYLGEGTAFMIVSRQGKLYRVDLTIKGDNVSLGEMQPVEIQFQPTERLATKTVIREVEEGIYRWFSISATSVLNKDGEIDSQALFDRFVDRIEETGEYPVRRFHHVNHDKFVTGKCDFVARADHTLITSGVFNDSKLAQLEIKAREEDPDAWGESIGYLPTEPPEMITVSGVQIPTYNDGVLREISTVRKENACSWFTTTALREEVTRMTLNQRVRDGLLDLFEGDEAALDTWLEDVEVTNREIVEQGLISREESDEEGAEEDPEASVSDELNREVILDDDALDAIVERFSAALDPLRERVVTLEEASETHRQEREDEAATVTEALEGLVSRIEQLEKPDEEKIEQALDDASPRMQRTRVRYRPRVERGNEEEEDDTPVSEMAAAAEQTLAVIPE
jgi:hypothetical protein